MDTNTLIDSTHRSKAIVAFAICLTILVGATVIASLAQRDFGKVNVTNVTYPNFNAIPVQAKLFRPVGATQDNPVPGVVYIHGYQNNRETSDAYCIELARRGLVVLNIDAIGRGNSGIPNNINDPDFDETHGGQTSLEYPKTLPFVDADRTGMMGHSLGAEMAYTVALNDPTINALVISGFAYTMEASATNPKNMLMIIGKWDEYRERMTGTRDIEKEWMTTPQTRKVIPVENPQLGVTYGDFAQGTAQRVFVPRTIHIQESHNRAAIAEALLWMKSALHPAEQDWVDPHSQIWPIKEWATLVTMLVGFASLLPLGLVLLQTKFFGSIRDAVSTTLAPTSTYSCSVKSYLKFVAINGILGMLASFVMNLFHIIGVLIMTTPISTWFYQLTGKIYLGTLVNAAIVTWMFTSSQVIAPIPV